jgi:DNA uptake protein ComE-like DNA-binding protein
MTLKFFSGAMAAIAMLLATNLTHAADPASEGTPSVTERTPAAVKKVPAAKADVTPKAKVKAKLKLVDINGANKAALMKLPGITSSDADKIIANRPYGSKTWLVSNKVINEASFYAIKALVEAKQPFKTAAENVAYFEKVKKEKAAKP